MADRFELSRRAFIAKTGLTGALVASGGLVAFLEACATGSSSPTSGQPVKGGTLTLATIDTPVNLDPMDLQMFSSIQAYDNIFGKLLEIDVDYNLLPALAVKWNQDDEKTWTLDLRDDVQFHNGDPFTADDVKYTFQRMNNHIVKAYLPAYPV